MYVDLNKWIFCKFLNNGREQQHLMLLGKAFQELGAQSEKAWSPYDEEVLGLVKRHLAEERRVQEGV